LVERIILLYLPFSTLQNLQFGINVTWYDAYYQQHDEILKIKSIFNYQMSCPNIKEMNDSINSKSKPLHLANIWNDNTDNEINDLCFTIHVTNTINIENYDS
jgi:hypothetical protein